MAAQPVNTATEATPRGGLPQMDTGTFPGQIFWLVITFGLLFLVFWRITLPMIEGVIGNRRNRIEGDLGSAEKLRQQAAEALANYEAELNGARNRAHQILDANRKNTNTELEAQKAQAETENQSAVKRADERIAADRARALGSLRPAAAEAAVAIVERLIGARVNPDEAANLIARRQESA